MKEIVTVLDVSRTAELVRIQSELQDRGFAHTHDESLGLPLDLPEHLEKVFFTDDHLGPEVEGVPPYDRMRARDVVEYERRGGQIALAEFITSAQPVNFDHSYDRVYNRPYALEDDLQARWVATLLSMVPLPERDTHGTIGINYTRTFNYVVGWAHQDATSFSAIYVTKRETKGATTILHPRDKNNPTEFRTELISYGVTLEPGEYLIFDDRMYKHNVTPLEPRHPGDDGKYRDTIIGQIQRSSNYNLSQYTFPAFSSTAGSEPANLDGI